MTKIIALLPMKLNSSRVPGKNFKEFCGKPLFRWTLDSLISIPEINKVIINTDAKEVLFQKGLEKNTKVILRDRPEEICGDDVSMNLIIADDINNFPADVYLMTHTTNPLLSRNTIISALKKFFESYKKGEADSLFTVNKVQTRFYKQDGSAVNHDPKNLIPTQDLEPWFEENSNLYIFTAESFMKTKARIGNLPLMHVTPIEESIDIDTPEDWDMGIITTEYLLKIGKVKL